MRGEWRVLVADTLTGQIRAEIAPAATPTFDRAINSKGQLSVSVSIDSGPNVGVDLHTYTRPGRYSWAVTLDDYLVQAGPVWTHTYNDASRTVDVTCGGMASLFARRVTRNPNGSASDPVPAIVNPSEDLHYTGLSLRGIMSALVADNLAQQHGALPIELPAPETGNRERTYHAYDLKPVLDNMTDLTGVIDGPDFEFVPEFDRDSTHIRWRLDVGDPLLGEQESTVVWDYGTEGSPITSLDVDVDGSASPAARVWVKGDGSERALLTGFAQNEALLGHDYPLTDYVDSDHTSVTQQSTLESYADADIQRLSAARETLTCDLRIVGRTADYQPDLASWRIGDAPLFAIQSHPWLPDGIYRRRVTGYSSSSASAITLTIDETPEATP